MVSRMFLVASASVLPWDQQPGSPGTQTAYPSSVCLSATVYFIVCIQSIGYFCTAIRSRHVVILVQYGLERHGSQGLRQPSGSLTFLSNRL